MKERRRKIAVSIIVFSALFSPATGARALMVEKIVATVDGAAVTVFELDQAVKTLGPAIQQKYGVTGNALRAKALDKLIEDKVLENEMEKTETKPEYKVEPHEIDSYIDRILRSNHISMQVFEQQIQEKGYTLPQYRGQLEDQLKKNKFVSNNIGRKVDVSERELKDYFDKHVDEFKSTATARLAQISIPFNQTTTDDDFGKMEKIAFELSKKAAAAKNLDALAKEYSEKPYLVHGGELGVVNLTDLQPPIAQAAAQLNAGQASTPIVTNTGIHIIKVLERSKISPKDFASVREQVHSVVYDMKMAEAMESYAKQLRKKAHIEIKSLGTGE